jgi:hypothetical protein
MAFIGNRQRGKYHCTVELPFGWFGLVCFAIKTKIFSCHTADSKQEVNSTVILPPLVFPAFPIILLTGVISHVAQAGGLVTGRHFHLGLLYAVRLGAYP